MAGRPRGKSIEDADGARRVVAKNANGEGSVYLDSKGTWRATYVDPTTGKRRTSSGRTKAVAASRRDVKITELAAVSPSGVLGAHPTIGAVAVYWIENVAAVQVRPSTLHTYRKDVRRIVAHLGAVPVADLNAEKVRRFLADLRRGGLAVPTTRNARTRLRQVAATAVELGYLVANPVPGVPAPQAAAEDRKQRRVLTVDEVRRLLAALDGTTSLDAAVAMLFTSGSRASEALGLAWSDLDLDAGTATVRRACTYTGGGVGPRLDRPKTSGTAGVHHLAPTVVALLRQRRAAQAVDRLAAGPVWQSLAYEGVPIDLVFTTATGGLPLRQRLYAAVRSACARAGIDPTGVGTHSGRRSTITALYVAGVPLEDVARHVGHSSPATTAGYVQDLGTRPQDTAAAAARLLDPTADGS